MSEQELHSQPVASGSLTPKDVSLRIAKVVDVYRSKGLDARVIGSYGQEASLQTEVFNASRPDGSYRDLDLTVLNIPKGVDITVFDEEARRVAAPLSLDTFNSLIVKSPTGGDAIKYKGITLPVRPEVTAQWNGSLAGEEIPTFPPQTLFHFYTLYLEMRPKDFHSALRFGRKFRGRDDLLPEEFYEPFHTITKLKKEQYPLDNIVGGIHYLYKKKVPEAIRSVLHPILGKMIVSFWNR